MIPQRVSCEHVPEANDTDNNFHSPQRSLFRMPIHPDSWCRTVKSPTTHASQGLVRIGQVCALDSLMLFAVACYHEL